MQLLEKCAVIGRVLRCVFTCSTLKNALHSRLVCNYVGIHVTKQQPNKATIKKNPTHISYMV